MLTSAIDPANVTQRAFEVILWLMLPALGTLVVVGVILSLLFAILQINDQALPITAKILTIVTFLVAMGHWMADMLLEFASEVFAAMGKI